MKFGFDLRENDKKTGKFKYNSGFVNTADAIFMRNSNTIILRVGTTSLNFVTSGDTNKNVQLNGIFYNPSTQLNTLESTIKAIAVYISSE